MTTCNPVTSNPEMAKRKAGFANAGGKVLAFIASFDNTKQ